MRSLVLVLLLVSFSSVASADDADEIIIQNDLAPCVTIKMTNVSTKETVVLARPTFELHKAIGECGCFSALASYTSSVKIDGVQQNLQSGVISLKRGGPKTLILASEPALVARKKVRIQLSCTPAL